MPARNKSYNDIEAKTQSFSPLKCVVAERFLASLAARNYSLHTRKSYRSDLQKFEEWLAQEGVRDPAEAHLCESDELSAWLVYSNKSGLSPATITRRLASVRALHKYALKSGNSNAEDKNLRVKPPKRPKYLPKDLDVEQIDSLFMSLEAAAATYDWHAIRDWAIVELIYSGGMRLSELVGCDLQSLDFGSMQVRVLGKGGRERDLPVGQKAATALKHWLKIRSDKAEPRETALFVSEKGKRISSRSVELRINKIGLEAGLGKIHPHQLRHSFASHMLQSGSDLRTVQELLGHTNISTTQIYTNLDWVHLSQTYDQAHPRSKMPSKMPAKKSAKKSG